MKRSNPKVRPITDPADPFGNGLPSNVELERWTLGAILRDGTGFTGLDELQPGDFFLEKHRRIFAAVCRVYEDGDPINYATVYDALELEHWTESCDGLSGLVELSDLRNTGAYSRPSAASMRTAIPSTTPRSTMRLSWNTGRSLATVYRAWWSCQTACLIECHLKLSNRGCGYYSTSPRRGKVSWRLSTSETYF